MAGETKGVAYEALTKLVLEDLKSEGKLKGRIFWGEKPEDMTIKPDLTIGRSANAPEICLLITHSGAAGNSHMKYWRNMGELVEEKVFLPSPAKVYNLAFDSIIKADLKKVQEASFDGQLLVGDLSYGDHLQRWVDSNLKNFPKDKEDKLQHLRDLLLSDHELKLLHIMFKRDIETLLGKNAPKELDEIWKMERARKKGTAPKRRDTFLRRGMAKLMVIPNAHAIDFKSLMLAKGTSATVTELVKELNIGSSSLAGIRISDPEAAWPILNLDTSDFHDLHNQRSNPKILEWIDVLETLPSLGRQLEYVVKNWMKVTDAKMLYNELKECKLNPAKVAPSLMSQNGKRVWLFHLLVELIKQSRGSRTSYGLAKVVSDLESAKKDPLHQREVESILGRKPRWFANHTVGLGLTDWHSRPSKQNFAFTDDDLARLASVLASRLRTASCPDASIFEKELRESIIQTLFEAKLLTYRGFAPHEYLIDKHLRAKGIKPRLQKASRSCFAQRAETEEIHLDPRSGGTTIMVANSTIINWQSAHGSHTNDKKKELCGRAVALRYSWDSKAKKFIQRPGVQKLILVLDGTWKQSDLDALVRSGWDEIFYPDEMDQLAKAIV